MNNMTDQINEGPLVSVGIPAYNRPEGLRHTLECITNQTYKNLQIIVSNNGSPDPAVETVIREYVAKDRRITAFTQPENRGPGFNILFVLRQAAGGYFMWAMDDDDWAPNFIAETLHLLQANPQAVAAFCAVKEKESGQITDYLQRCPDLSSPDLNKRLMAYLAWPEGPNTKGSVLYSLHKRKNILACHNKIETHHDDRSLGPDIIMLYLLLINGPIVFSHEPLYIVTMRNVKYVGYRYKRHDFFGGGLLLSIKKGLDLLYQREKFYFLVAKTIWNSGAAKVCFWYALYTIGRRHLHAFRMTVIYPFKKIYHLLRQANAKTV